jgi:hypothetical protein
MQQHNFLVLVSRLKLAAENRHQDNKQAEQVLLKTYELLSEVAGGYGKLSLYFFSGDFIEAAIIPLTTNMEYDIIK